MAEGRGWSLFQRNEPSQREASRVRGWFRQFGVPNSARAGANNELGALNRIPAGELLKVYRQEPMIRRGILKHSGDLTRENFHVVDPDQGENTQDEEFQAWAQAINLKGKMREAMVACHLYGDAIVERIFDDELPADEEPPAGATLVDVQVLDGRNTTLTWQPQEDGSWRVGAKQRATAKPEVIFHPSRIHHFRLHAVPGEVRGLSTVEAAYHTAMSKVQSDQALGEIVRHHGPGLRHAQVEGGNQKTIDMINGLFEDSKMLRGLATGDDVTITQHNASSMGVADYYEAFYTGIAAAIGMPVAMLKGVQAGAVTGSETNRADYQDDLMQTRHNTLDPFIHRTIEGRLGVPHDHEWDDFQELPQDMARMVDQKASAYETLRRSGIPGVHAAKFVGIDLPEEAFTPGNQDDRGLLSV